MATEKEAFAAGYNAGMEHREWQETAPRHIQGLGDTDGARNKNPFARTAYGQPINYPALGGWYAGFDRALKDFANGHRQRLQG